MEYPASKTREGLTLVTLIGRCPSCGTETISEPFYGLAGPGRMLEAFQPTSGHLCPSSRRRFRVDGLIYKDDPRPVMADAEVLTGALIAARHSGVENLTNRFYFQTAPAPLIRLRPHH